jgi:hypothetical protein
MARFIAWRTLGLSSGARSVRTGMKYEDGATPTAIG